MFLLSLYILLPLCIFFFLFQYCGAKGLFEDGGTQKKQENVNFTFVFAAVLLVSFLLRVVLAFLNEGHVYDMNCFLVWSDAAYKNGFSSFYTSDMFTDYPPGYIYILYVIGFLKHILHVENSGILAQVITKLPAICFDLLSAGVLYKFGKKYLSQVGAIVVAGCVLFHPAIIFNSSIWGQVDSVFTFFVLLLCIMVAERKMIPAYFAFGIGILIKPQVLFFAPVLIIGIIDHVFLCDFSWKRFFKHFGCGLGAIGSVILLCLPFGVNEVVAQYLDTISSYPYATINGYNFWAVLGFNWQPETVSLFGLSAKTLGMLFLVLIVAGVFLLRYLVWKKTMQPYKYFILAGILIGGIFCFSTHMHERYLYPIVVLLPAAFLYGKKKNIFFLWFAFSYVHYMNTVHVFYYYDVKNFSSKAPIPKLVGALTVAAFIALLYSAFKIDEQTEFAAAEETQKEEQKEQEKKEKLQEQKEQEKKEEQQEKKEQEETLRVEGTKSEGIQEKKTQEGENYEEFLLKKRKKIKIFCLPVVKKLQKLDICLILGLMLVYGIIAFHDLGDTKSVENFYYVENDAEPITLEFDRPVEFSTLGSYLGFYERRNFELEASNDGFDYENYTTLEFNSVFSWQTDDLKFIPASRYIRLTSVEGRFSLGELVFVDKNGENVLPVNAASYPELFDEQSLYSGESTYKNSTIFDEIYHARTAYEYIHGYYSYENTHPPLGKILISLGIRMFGMNPFGWRFMGTLFGVLMIPVFYLLARRLLKDRKEIAFLATVLFTFDFMHFTQTRIATIDVFVTFFNLLSYYFMAVYLSMVPYTVKLRKCFLPLGLSGLSMGLAIACKWTGIYSACGLAVVFFVSVGFRIREYCIARNDPDGETDGIENEVIVHTFPGYLGKTICFCIGAFVFVPAVIYTLSYLPFRDGVKEGLFERMFRNQETMWNYHKNLEATHYYSSSWYQWPIITKPILYYNRQVGSGRVEGISAMGNPLVWWTGIFAFVYSVYTFFMKKDKVSLFLIVGFFAQYLPWVFVERLTFIYHYFPSVPFITLMIGTAMGSIRRKYKKSFYALVVFTCCSVVLFAMFYPVISGHAVNAEFGDKFLRWFDSWVLFIAK